MRTYSVSYFYSNVYCFNVYIKRTVVVLIFSLIPFLIYFSANGLAILSDDDGMQGSYVFAYYQGSVYWVTAANIVSQCVVDITYYPFDKQECHMIVS